MLEIIIIVSRYTMTRARYSTDGICQFDSELITHEHLRKGIS